MVITDSKSNASKIFMNETATINAFGHGFLAQDRTIRNAAGPKGNQAVAQRSNSNKSVVYRCRVEGYEDTLYAENGLQFYVESNITGTVDFVFGNAKPSSTNAGFRCFWPWVPGPGPDDRNAAGLEGNQAVALRSNSNKSVVYRCRVEGYKDTLYAENGLQFYVESNITGTVDFVFGNAKAVFHKCRIQVRRPLEQKHNVVTAQGRYNATTTDSGFVFHE
ncbi:putative pectinesterase/pectinesterase inhibitor 38 [Setaria italica]|uniref:putative pectinesterase/pectinesterase inhibitor 38 n=1 Tax=Setaria italica TaxID=4555 RepID=UPI000350D69F|nr:putative pectinesterase/pectinesterase inhibitor 38 [Setaria italica]